MTDHPQVENLRPRLQGQRGAAHAREPAFADQRSQDGEAQSAPSERSPGGAQGASGDGRGQPEQRGTKRLTPTG